MRQLFALALAITLTGCGSTPPEDRYYSLVLQAADEGAVATSESADVVVNLTHIDLPAFLDSRAMVLQTGANEVEIAQHNFWAESLDEAIGKVLVRDIAQSSRRIDIARNTQRDAACELRVEFDRFHATDSGRVLASGRYVLSSGNVTRQSGFDVSQRLSTDGYASAVVALRRSLADLATHIINEVEARDACRPAAAEQAGAGDDQ